MKKILLCFLICFNFLFAQINTPEFYERQMNVLRNLDINPSFISDLIFVQTQQDIKSKHAQTLIDSMQNFSKVTPMIRKILAQQEVPDEILYLAMVESGLKTHSVSNAKAVGVWQFMQPTARNLGLRIDAYVDERRDPVKSTYAATNYLKELKEEAYEEVDDIRILVKKMVPTYHYNVKTNKTPIVKEVERPKETVEV